jgi:hypothetical protein
MDCVKILIDSNQGIYIPKRFAETILFSVWRHVTKEQINTLLEGPDSMAYWDTWNDVLSNAVLEDIYGNVWMLHHDGDLFLVCEERMTDDQRKEFFGE